MTTGERGGKQVMMGVGADDLKAIKYILLFYGRYLQSGQAGQPVSHRSINRIQLVLLKVEQIISGQVILLRWDELGLITEAIATFTELVRRKIAASKERDEVLANCEQLHDYLSLVLPSIHPTLKGGGSLS
ncbi:hypothetical protein KTAU_12340 [Thermogemmatispora aurantia]|uniref:Uncharacterized protein n=2 Tax=Thermogemmatisporaceae TaxID=768668 RepID=A0A5J4K7H2_9CHLR|nr:hypothetical protein KTAU_12340 [Thermogemmatispora aurantia]